MSTRAKVDRFPLWRHPTGQWCKKHRGVFHYFGDDKDAALKRFVAEWDDIKAGRTRPPVPPVPDRLTVRELVNQFLTAKRERVNSGEITGLLWTEYFDVSKAVVAAFGRHRVVADLRPTDFGALRAEVSKRLGPVALAKFITMTRTLFRYGLDAELLDRPVRFGKLFEKPSRGAIRRARQVKGPKLLAADVIWKLLDAATVQMRAMILLGINCGLGQKDCSDLTRSVLATRPGWLDYPRPKTGIERRAPLWPETIRALEAVASSRPDPKDPADSDCLFITLHGRRWCRFIDRGDQKRGCTVDAASQEFARLRQKVGVKTPGGPYVLRHTFRTVADETRDFPAIDLIMGHHDDSMASHYRERISDERLTGVTDYVRRWLLDGRPTA